MSLSTSFVENYDMKKVSQFLASYTFGISVLFNFFIIHMSINGDTTQLFNPLFKMDVDKPRLCVMFSIVFFINMIISSLAMLNGINVGNKSHLFPWIIGTEIVIFCVIAWSLWLLNVYIPAQIILAVMFYWIMAALQLYYLFCIFIQYCTMKQENKTQANIIAV